MNHLIVGDVHLGKGLSIGKSIPGELNSRNIDKIKLLDWILEQAKLHKVQRISFTGDIFEDSKPDYLIFKIWLEFLVKCKHNNLIIDIVYGNHDIKRIGQQYYSVLDLIGLYHFDNVFLYKDIQSIELNDNCNFCFVPFRDRRSFNTESNQEALQLLHKEISSHIKSKKTNVIVGHLTLEGSLYVGDEIDDFHNELMCPISIFQGFDYVWMGHIHKPQTLSSNIEHVGSLDISDFGETDHKKVIILFDSATKKTTKINIPTRPLRLVECLVPDLEEPQKFAQDFIQSQEKINSFQDSIVKIIIKYNNKYSLDRKEIEKTLYNLKVFNICSFIEQKSSNIIPIQKKNLMSGIAEPKAAVKVYTENNSKFIDDQYKSDFIEFCDSVIDQMDK